MKFETKNKDIIYCKRESYNKKYDNNKFYTEKYCSDGYKFNSIDRTWYWLGYLIHRENGPAIEWNNGVKAWCLNGISYSEEEYWNIISMRNKMKVLDEV